MRGRRRAGEIDQSGSPRPRIIDSDVDLHDPAQRAETSRREWDLLAVIALGGVIGAEARYGLGLALPHRPGQFAWSTVLINVTGCFLLGVLMVVLLGLSTPHRLARPFFGVGILGGYTTFSTFAVDVQQMLVAHRAGAAVGYVLATVLTSAAAVAAGTWLTRRAGRVRPRPTPDRDQAVEGPAFPVRPGSVSPGSGP